MVKAKNVTAIGGLNVYDNKDKKTVQYSVIKCRFCDNEKSERFFHWTHPENVFWVSLECLYDLEKCQNTDHFLLRGLHLPDAGMRPFECNRPSQKTVLLKWKSTFDVHGDEGKNVAILELIVIISF